MLDRTDLEPLFFAPFILLPVMKVEQSWIDYNGHLNITLCSVLFDRCVDEASTARHSGAGVLEDPAAFDLQPLKRTCAISRELREGEPVRATFQLLKFRPSASTISSSCSRQPTAGCRPPRKTSRCTSDIDDQEGRGATRETCARWPG